jgi:hypothetical protein
MIQIVRNGRAVVFGVARAQPGRANILNCRDDLLRPASNTAMRDVGC